MSEKTHKGLKKRLKRTGRGKVLRRHSRSGHLLSKKSRKRKRRLGQWTEVSPGDLKAFERQYGKI